MVWTGILITGVSKDCQQLDDFAGFCRKRFMKEVVFGCRKPRLWHQTVDHQTGALGRRHLKTDQVSLLCFPTFTSPMEAWLHLLASLCFGLVIHWSFWIGYIPFLMVILSHRFLWTCYAPRRECGRTDFFPALGISEGDFHIFAAGAGLQGFVVRCCRLGNPKADLFWKSIRIACPDSAGWQLVKRRGVRSSTFESFAQDPGSTLCEPSAVFQPPKRASWFLQASWLVCL